MFINTAARCCNSYASWNILFIWIQYTAINNSDTYKYLSSCLFYFMSLHRSLQRRQDTSKMVSETLNYLTYLAGKHHLLLTNKIVKTLLGVLVSRRLFLIEAVQQNLRISTIGAICIRLVCKSHRLFPIFLMKSVYGFSIRKKSI